MELNIKYWNQFWLHNFCIHLLFYSNFLFSVSEHPRFQRYTDRSPTKQLRVHCVLISDVMPNYLSSTAILSFYTSSMSIISSLSPASSQCLYGFRIYSDICFCYAYSWWEQICLAYMHVCFCAHACKKYILNLGCFLMDVITSRTEAPAGLK